MAYLSTKNYVDLFKLSSADWQANGGRAKFLNKFGSEFIMRVEFGRNGDNWALSSFENIVDQIEKKLDSIENRVGGLQDGELWNDFNEKVIRPAR